MFDINLTFVNLEEGIEKSVLPGLVVLTPTRKAARGREMDTIIALASISGAAGITPESVNAWLQKKVEGFYATPGTVTFAMKTLLEAMNIDLMERNLRRAKEGKRITASLALVVLRRGSIYTAITEGARAYFASGSDSQDFSDLESKGKGLGISQSVNFRFVQQELQENDLLVISSQPSEAWQAQTFAGSTGLLDDAVGRRLFNQAGKSFKAAMLRFVKGKGGVTQSAMVSHAVSTPVVTEIPAITESSVLTSKAQPEPLPEWIMTEGQKADQSAATSELRPEEMVAESIDITTRIVNEPITPESIAEVEAETPKKASPSTVQVKAGKLTKKMVAEAEGAGSAFSRFIQKILPGLADEPLKLSPTALIGISVIVPVVILFLAGMVYMKQGQSKQFDQNLVMAQQYYMQAELQVNDPPLYLASLQQSLFWLEKAESYGRSDLSNSLRLKVQGELDILQGVQRLEMVEVIAGGLPAGSNISQIVANSTDLYLLEEESGSILHYYMGSAGYEKDDDFSCGSSPDNVLSQLGKLIDMAPLNVNNQFRATVLGVDAKGNTVFCIPGEAGIAGSLVPPDQGWKQLKAVALDGGYLYALDSGGRAVYRYEGNGVLFENMPVLFFDNQIPDLTKAIDIEVNGDELYILRNNGQMVECTYSHLKDYKLTECLDPAPYGDMRTGQTPQAISFPESNFVQMRMTAAPDSSIYLLDAHAKAIYHFSLQRNLQKILHPRLMDGYNLDVLSPTAIAVSSSRTAFIAFGSQIYYAQLP